MWIGKGTSEYDNSDSRTLLDRSCGFSGSTRTENDDRSLDAPYPIESQYGVVKRIPVDLCISKTITLATFQRTTMCTLYR